jgi:hypothetical protein
MYDYNNDTSIHVNVCSKCALYIGWRPIEYQEINSPRTTFECVEDHRVTWSEMRYGEVLVDKGAMYIRINLYCGYLITLWLFHLCISCTVFVLSCIVVVLYSFVMCGCVCSCVCMCGFWNVCVCVRFAMCGCFSNMYTVLWLRFSQPDWGFSVLFPQL